jgi:hypothetical protein
MTPACVDLNELFSFAFRPQVHELAAKRTKLCSPSRCSLIVLGYRCFLAFKLPAFGLLPP